MPGHVAYLLRWDHYTIAATRPASPDQLLAKRGMGPLKLEQYGRAILDIVADQSPTLTGEMAWNRHTS